MITFIYKVCISILAITIDIVLNFGISCSDIIMNITISVCKYFANRYWHDVHFISILFFGCNFFNILSFFQYFKIINLSEFLLY